ncbi:unnamed protein product [Durusdinium trenchii]|uniref:C3H1-type domain-containing protein n=1 Tax=Durusdinium trenchii TaxID=1381693 RepID=A0ABP0JNG7_9DINO
MGPMMQESDSSVDQASGDSSTSAGGSSGQRLSQLSQSLGGDQGEVSDGKVSALRQSIRILHEQGHCKPCRYFRFREDGCRHGDACPFCHDCTAEESMAGQKWQKHQRQREKRRQQRRQWQ